MAVATFETLKFANTLKAAGVPDKQAEAQAVAYAEVVQLNLKDLVNKDDLARTVAEISAKIDFLSGQFKETETRLTAKIDTHAVQTKGEMTLLKWMFAAGATAAIGILVRLFFIR